MTEMHTKAKDLYSRAHELQGEAREAFLSEACGADAELRLEIQRMLVEGGQADAFFGDSEADTVIAQCKISPPTMESEGDVIGPYKLLQKIGEGGFGEVWMAEQRVPISRKVALKLVKAGMDTKEVLTRFEAERQALAMMDHPNIAKVLDAGATSGGRPFFAMELVKGVPITQFCDDQKLGTRERLELFRDVCAAVNHAHQKGIIHRDLKPSNVMITLYSDKPVPKVIDFGIAKATQGKLTDKTLFTRYEQFIGTPVYMSPEQAAMSAMDIDTRSDIYSLGVLLYELLAGKPPFDAGTLVSAGYDEMRRIIKEDEPLKPSTRLTQTGGGQTGKHPDVSPGKLRGDLDCIVMKAIDKDRTRRYETANAFAEDIGRHISDEPVTASAPSAVYKIRKFARRNKAAFRVGIAIAAILVVATVVGFGLAVQKGKAVKIAKTSLAEAERQKSLSETNAHKLRLHAYCSDVHAAAKAIASGHLKPAQNLLNRHIPKPGEEDIRGFGWHHLSSLSGDQNIATIGEYSGTRGGIAVTEESGQDGPLVAYHSGTEIVIQRCPNGQVIERLETRREGGKSKAGVLRFSPGGEFLVCAEPNSVRRWRTSTWKEELPVLNEIGIPFVYTPDGKFVVARTGDQLIVRDAEKWERVRVLKGGYEASKDAVYNFQRLTISPEGDTVFAAHAETVRAWNVDTGEMHDQNVTTEEWIFCISMSPTGLLAIGMKDGKVALWDRDSRQITQTLHTHAAWIPAITFSRDGKQMYTASGDRTICVFDIGDDRQATLRTRLSGHDNEIWAIAMAADGQHFYTGSKNDNSTRLWEIPPANQSEPLLFEGRAPLEFDEDQKTLIVLSMQPDDKSKDPGFRSIDLTTAGEPEEVTDMKIPAQVLASGNLGFEGHHPPPLHTKIANRTSIAHGTKDGISIWNLRTGELQKRIPKIEVVEGESTSSKIELAYSPDGSRFATADEINGLRLWNPGDDWSSIDLAPDFKHRGRLCFSADNRVLAAFESGADGNGIVIDLNSSDVILEIKLTGELTSIALSSDGATLALGMSENQIDLWDLATAEKVHTLNGHYTGLHGLAFSPDGRTLASCGSNQLKLWNVETGFELMTLAESAAWIRFPLFSPDGKIIVAYVRNGKLRAWHAPTLE